MYNDALQQLKTLLEGKTIHQVLPPIGPEHICKFVMQDGSSFELGATDLGYWIDGQTNAAGHYNTLTDLVGKLYEHRYKLNTFSLPDPIVSMDGEMLVIDAIDGTLFHIPIIKLTNLQKSFLADEMGLKKLGRVMSYGQTPTQKDLDGEWDE